MSTAGSHSPSSRSHKSTSDAADSTALTRSAPSTEPGETASAKPRIDVSKALPYLAKQLHFQEGVEAFARLGDKLTSNFDNHTYARKKFKDTLSRVWKDKKLPRALQNLPDFDNSAVDTEVRSTMREWEKRVVEKRKTIRAFDDSTGGAVSSRVWKFIDTDDRFKWGGTDVGSKDTAMSNESRESAGSTAMTELAKSTTGTETALAGPSRSRSRKESGKSEGSDRSVFSDPSKYMGMSKTERAEARQRATARANAIHREDVEKASTSLTTRKPGKSVSIGGRIGRTGGRDVTTTGTAPSTAPKSALRSKLPNAEEIRKMALKAAQGGKEVAGTDPSAKTSNAGETRTTELPESIKNMLNSIKVPATTAKSGATDSAGSESAAPQMTAKSAGKSAGTEKLTKEKFVALGGDPDKWTEEGWKDTQRRVKELLASEVPLKSLKYIETWAPIRNTLSKALKTAEWLPTATEGVFTRSAKQTTATGEEGELIQHWNKNLTGRTGRSEQWITREFRPHDPSDFMAGTEVLSLAPTTATASELSTSMPTAQSRRPTASQALTTTAQSKKSSGGIVETLTSGVRDVASKLGSAAASTVASAAKSLASSSWHPTKAPTHRGLIM